MTDIIPNPDGKEIIDLEVLVNEEKKEVYVKFSGFDTLQNADDYAEYLLDLLPLMLFESETKH
jgi:hypothetical protein